MARLSPPLDRIKPWRIGIYTGGEVIGDGLWKLPFIRALRSAFPNAHIIWIARSHTVYAGSLAPVVEGLLDTVLDDSGVIRRISDLFKPRPAIGPFDIILDTQRTVWRAFYLRRLLSRQPRGLMIAPASTYLFSDIKPEPGQQLPRHLGRLFVQWIEWLVQEPVQLDRGIELPADIVAKAGQALPDSGKCYVGFVPGAGDRRKCWPLARYIDLAGQLVLNRPDAVPVFFLGPDEADWRDEIAAAVPSALFPEQCQDIWGEGFSPLRAIALGQRLSLAVSNDCGTGHMLAAADCPLISLFGPTEAEKFKPITAGGCAVIHALDFGDSVDMDAIPVRPVLDGVLQKL